jgi:uncharacterized glyoxalase superfamily protein PhnB
MEFYKTAFGAVETPRVPGSQGKLMHTAIRIGDSAVMLNDEFPEFGVLGSKSLDGSPVVIHLYVENADDFADRAVEAGARIAMPIADMFRGDRYGQLEDPFGHRWSVATQVRDVGPDEMRQAIAKMGG